MQFLPQLVGNSFTATEGKAAFGLLANGDTLVLQRNPDNPYDANAIEVHTPSGIMLGHVNKEIAADLAPIMDNEDGAVAEGHESTYTCIAYDCFTNAKRPTLLVEITTGWEVDTEVHEATPEGVDEVDGEAVGDEEE